MKVLRIILLIVGAIIALFLIIPLFLGSEYYVEREISIDRAPEVVFSKAADYSIRGEWDPWLEMDKSATYEHNRTDDLVGSHYSWKGDTIGEGSMTIAEFDRPNSITSDLEFKVPFESKSKVYWNFESLESGGTLVSWANEGEMPYLARYFTSGMDAQLGPSFEKGLQNFKALIESTTAPADTTKAEEEE